MLRSVTKGYVTTAVKKSNRHYARGVAPNRLTSGGAHLRGLAPRQHSSEEISWR